MGLQWQGSSAQKFFQSLSGWVKTGAVLGVLAALAVLGGRAGWYFVSSVVVEQLSKSADADGMVYFLPRSMAILDVTYQITRCDVERRGKAETDPLDVLVAVDIGLTLTEKAEPDHANAYLIRSDSLSGALWRTEIIVDVTNGLLKSINSGSTAEVEVPKGTKLPDILGTVLSTGRLTPPAAAGSAPTPQEHRAAVCGKALIQALDKPDAKPAGADPTKVRRQFYIDPGGGCPADMKNIEKKPGDQGPLLSCTFNSEPMLAGLLADPLPVGDALQRYDIEFRVLSKSTAPAAKTKLTGIVYRMPGSATVQACSPKCGAGARLVTEKIIVVPQFGPLAAVAVERRLFSDRTTQLEFGTWGELTKAKFVDAATKTSEKK